MTTSTIDTATRDRRVRDTLAQQTGRLDDVSSIAGYVLAASGKRYALVFIVNHRNAARAQEAQDALLQWVYDNG